MKLHLKAIARLLNCLSLCLLLVMTAVAASCAKSSDTQSTASSSSTNAQYASQTIPMDQPITAPAATLIVYGMGCPLCANNVDKELLSVPGVSSAAVDMSNGFVKLTFTGDNRPTPNRLAQSVKNAGFTYKGITIP